jgi:microcin C transport system substrate-binding protein
MNFIRSLLVIIFFLLAGNFINLLTSMGAHAVENTITHGISIFGDLKYKNNFKHFDYVNPRAPKGGMIKIAEVGSYDSLNPFIMKGVSASGIEMIFDTLMKKSSDEETAEYGLIAESVELDNDRNQIIFNLRKEARWHDGSYITAHDVKFSFDTIKEKGNPQYRAYYKDVSEAIVVSSYKIKFLFTNNQNRELPIILGQLPVFSKEYYSNVEFEKTTLIAPLGSGPYKVKTIDPGRSITYERVENYWAENLPVNIGHNNYDLIKIDYYRDATVAVEALKAGEYDIRRENISKTWDSAYNLPHINDGRMIKIEYPDGQPTGMQCFTFNTRKSLFSDVKIREALSYAYDFEWANKQLFYSAYTRNRSYFGNSIFESKGLPSKEELNLLNPYKDILPADLFTNEFHPPVANDNLAARQNLLKAQQILDDSGWILKDMKRINPNTGEAMHIEFLLVSPSFERVVSPFVRNLKKLGISSSIRTVDSSQYIKRLEDFDFDIMVHWFQQGMSPGNEQINYWHSSYADVKGSQNYAGVRNKAADAMVEKIISAKNKEELIYASRALDRILQWNFYTIPQWHSRTHRMIFWNKFGVPEIIPPYSLGYITTWWIDQQKEQKLNKILNKE